MKLEVRCFLISKLITRLQRSKWCGTAVKTEMQTNRVENPYVNKANPKISHKDAETVQCGRQSAFNGLGKTA